MASDGSIYTTVCRVCVAMDGWPGSTQAFPTRDNFEGMGAANQCRGCEPADPLWKHVNGVAPGALKTSGAPSFTEGWTNRRLGRVSFDLVGGMTRGCIADGFAEGENRPDTSDGLFDER
jgi:hypothetical protein